MESLIDSSPMWDFPLNYVKEVVLDVIDATSNWMEALYI
jgi:hypothetical protein